MARIDAQRPQRASDSARMYALTHEIIDPVHACLYSTDRTPCALRWGAARARSVERAAGPATDRRSTVPRQSMPPPFITYHYFHWHVSDN